MGLGRTNLFPETRFGFDLNKSLPYSTEASLGFRNLNFASGKTVMIYTGSFGTMTDNTNQFQLKRYTSGFRETLNEPDMVYLKYNDNYYREERWKHWDILNEILEEENKKFTTIKTFVDWNGQNHTTIYKAVNKE